MLGAYPFDVLSFQSVLISGFKLIQMFRHFCKSRLTVPVQKLGDGAFTVLRYYRYHRIVAHDILLSPSVEELFANTARAKDICSRCGRPYFLSGVAHLEEVLRSNNNQNLIQVENDFNEAIRRNPYGLGAYLMLGETKILQGDFSEVRKFYERAMKDPKNRNAALAGLKNLEKNKSGAGLESSPLLK